MHGLCHVMDKIEFLEIHPSIYENL
jgi:hypothetical protein